MTAQLPTSKATQEHQNENHAATKQKPHCVCSATATPPMTTMLLPPIENPTALEQENNRKQNAPRSLPISLRGLSALDQRSPGPNRTARRKACECNSSKTEHASFRHPAGRQAQRAVLHQHKENAHKMSICDRSPAVQQSATRLMLRRGRTPPNPLFREIVC